MNEGKRFEKNIKDSLPGVIRLYDTTNGYAGIKNPCDFIYYTYPFQFLLECKSTGEDVLYFSAITENQHEQLDYYNHIYGVTSIVLIEFRKQKKVVIVPYKVIKELNTSDKKGIYYNEVDTLDNVYVAPATYKRVNMKLDANEFKILLRKVAMSQ